MASTRLSRRQFLKWSGLGSLGALVAGAISLPALSTTALPETAVLAEAAPISAAELAGLDAVLVAYFEDAKRVAERKPPKVFPMKPQLSAYEQYRQLEGKE